MRFGSCKMTEHATPHRAAGRRYTERQALEKATRLLVGDRHWASSRNWRRRKREIAEWIEAR